MSTLREHIEKLLARREHIQPGENSFLLWDDRQFKTDALLLCTTHLDELAAIPDQVRAAYEQGRGEAAPSPGMPSDLQALIDELEGVSARLTQYTSNPLDGLLQAAADAIRALHRPEQAEKDRAAGNAVLVPADKLSELQKDVERLTWLEIHFVSVHAIYDKDGLVENLDVDCEDDCVADGDRGRIRAAIDAAMGGKQVAAEDLGCLTEGEK